MCRLHAELLANIAAVCFEGDEIVEIYRRWFASFGRPSAVLEAAFILGAIPE